MIITKETLKNKRRRKTKSFLTKRQEKMPRRKGRYENRATFKTKKSAIRHGYITYGRTRTGARKFRIWRVKGGWSISRK